MGTPDWLAWGVAGSEGDTGRGCRSVVVLGNIGLFEVIAVALRTLLPGLSFPKQRYALVLHIIYRSCLRVLGFRLMFKKFFTSHETSNTLLKCHCLIVLVKFVVDILRCTTYPWGTVGVLQCEISILVL